MILRAASTTDFTGEFNKGHIGRLMGTIKGSQTPLSEIGLGRQTALDRNFVPFGGCKIANARSVHRSAADRMSIFRNQGLKIKSGESRHGAIRPS